MEMNAMFAASLFDNPWVVAVVVIVGVLTNWLAKRRQEKQAGPTHEGDEAPPPAEKPVGGFNLEDAIRRLMGEEPPVPRPVPPPIPRANHGELPPTPEWQEEEAYETARPTAPPLRPPPIGEAQASISANAAGEQLERAARRFEQLNDQGRHPATVVSHGREHRSRAASRAASRWRNPRSARQAFVASMVFAPPKSLEP